MLIKRTEREARRGTLAASFASQSGGALDRRTFLRRSGVAAGGLAALGTLQIGQVRKADAGPPAPPGARVTMNGNFKGLTPLVFKLGKWAFDARKTSIFSKHLTGPVNVEISQEGYQTERASLAEGPLVWRSLNGQNTFTYWVITIPEYSVQLRPITRVRIMTNVDVIDLVKGGLSEGLVIDKIQASAGDYRTELEDISALKKAGVSDAVVSAMIKKAPQETH